MTPTPSNRSTGRGVATAARRSIPDPPKRVLLAVIGSNLTPEVIGRTAELAAARQARITVLGIARVYGTTLGLPHPGLQPNRFEWEGLRALVEEAATTLRAKGFEVRVALARSRNAPKLIAKWVEARSFHAVVVGDQQRPRWRVILEGDLARDIGRRSGVPVHAVPVRRSQAGARGRRSTGDSSRAAS